MSFNPPPHPSHLLECTDTLFRMKAPCLGPLTAVGVDAAVVQEADPEVVQHGGLVEEAEGGEVVGPLQDGGVPQERELAGGRGRQAGLLGTEGCSEGLGDGDVQGGFLYFIHATSLVESREKNSGLSKRELCKKGVNTA